MVVYIVTNKGALETKPQYSDSIKVYTDKIKALRQYLQWIGPDGIAWAKMMGVSDQVGVRNIYKSGDIDVEMYVAEVIE